MIPVYNAAAFLPTCFSGLKAQVFQEFEAIFVDDGSTDTTGRILTQAVALEPHFRMIQQNHKNAGSARNKGLQEVKSMGALADEYEYLICCSMPYSVWNRQKQISFCSTIRKKGITVRKRSGTVTLQNMQKTGRGSILRKHLRKKRFCWAVDLCGTKCTEQC